jgi:predicted AAA+ superfamily ATPase
VGKSTLLRSILQEPAILLDFSDPAQRGEYLRNPERLIARCRALPRRRSPAVVFVDEAQNVPAIFDAVQHLYDADRRSWRFVLCGSSARKLRVTGANLLPGRSILHRLFALVVDERPFPESPTASLFSPLVLPSAKLTRRFPSAPLEERLVFGELPGIITARRSERASLLQSYTLVYLQEELRREAMVRDWTAFARFLPLAAAESGNLVNYSKIAKDAGVSVPTIKSYYQLLEDMFLGFRLPAYSKSPRKNLLSTDRFLFFDLGVRNAAAELPLQSALVRANPGPLFEQWVGIELWKRIGYLGQGRLHYLRTKSGAEVDFIVERAGKLTPVEVKWTERPTAHDARHLLTMIRDQPKAISRAYLVCRTPEPLELAPKVIAIPWFMI